MSSKQRPYRTYRSGRPRSDDPEAARFAFDRGGAGTETPPRPSTPVGMPAPPMRRYRASPLPGREVARAAKPPADGGKRRLRLGWKRGILLAVLVLLAALGAWLYIGYRAFSDEVAKANARIDRRTRAALAPAGHILTSPQVSMIMGTDNRQGGAISGARADSILLVRTDPSKHLISMLSIPRDMRVPIAGVGDDKINSAFSAGGPPLLIRTVDAFTGVPVNHVILVDFRGFRELIDALGGVTVRNPHKITASQPFDGYLWHFKQGDIHMNGYRALAYARIRHTTNPRDTDISRTERQQQVLQAIAHQLVSPLNLFNLPSIGRAVAKPLATDLSANELLGLGWVKFRAQRTLECHLGGTPQTIAGQDVLVSSEQNRSVVQMFLGRQAPLPPARGQLFAPGCRVR